MTRILFSLILAVPFWLFSQDFYINKQNKISYPNLIISSEWIDLNIEESYDFLYNSGFSKVKKTTNKGLEIVKAKYRFYDEDVFYTRSLIFENKLIVAYSDEIRFFQPCNLCFANTMMNKITSDPGGIFKKGVKRGLEMDTELKERFYYEYQQSLRKDGIESNLNGNITDFSSSFDHFKETDNYQISRIASIELDPEIDGYYTFHSARMVKLIIGNYNVGVHNLKSINQYDLRQMIDVFLLDCQLNEISIKNNKIFASFETLDDYILGLSYGKNDDSRIELKIDPEKWANASVPKRWYLLYHELGHDVLNLEHGSGGKMMFNFADRGYSWSEFWEDRAYMFKSYKRHNLSGQHRFLNDKNSNYLKIGSHGEEVKELQKFLGITADGAFGARTKSAVIKWQKENNLSADGLVGTNTWNLMGLQNPMKEKAVSDGSPFNTDRIENSLTIKSKQTANQFTIDGYIKYLKKDYSGAIADFSEAIKINPDDGRAYYFRGHCWRYLGQKDYECLDLIKAEDLEYGDGCN